ncbi:conserved hypothetical protein [Nostocoides japonicum T1-X7]|uniref:Nudix hydrolase domain-containing protein n=1 Tax=Nostocoides japonicum T1-X7 TaxID=1194083 RepID=A0A077LYZ0_9MICO|nr:NUDIX hydrolase [Tetrasphaera japonica]CCH77205.1 conserved hypothetical protein [Tetrasphaera japonica T1-X7]
MTVIPAAGTIPWRRVDDVLQVALVHRPRYDDWSWPKGKVDSGEDWPVAAVRETFEETGLRVRLGMPLPTAEYVVLERDGTPATKSVRYWAAEVIGGKGRLVNEIDEVAWLDVQTAYDRLDYARDRDQLLAVVRADQQGVLRTRTVAVVRHAQAVARSDWKGRDADRPLDARGRRRSDALVPVLAAYAIDRVVSSPSLRCRDTLAPYAISASVRMRLRRALSEEGFEADPTGAEARTRKEIRRLRAMSALCSHRPVLPVILEALATVAPAHEEARRTLLLAAKEGMDKGEALVAHLAVTPEPSIVAVERHLP